mmetsp:Transcript_126718/g.289847  ORF Transcript_126718/g.289847 Transcript_126718/m.289847 type:complete len:230 (-) Transcript_126718:489-1178(-)
MATTHYLCEPDVLSELLPPWKTMVVARSHGDNGPRDDVQLPLQCGPILPEGRRHEHVVFQDHRNLLPLLQYSVSHGKVLDGQTILFHGHGPGGAVVLNHDAAWPQALPLLVGNYVWVASHENPSEARCFQLLSHKWHPCCQLVVMQNVHNADCFRMLHRGEGHGLQDFLQARGDGHGSDPDGTTPERRWDKTELIGVLLSRRLFLLWWYSASHWPRLVLQLRYFAFQEQ